MLLNQEQCQHGLLKALSVDWGRFWWVLCAFLTLDFPSPLFLLTHNEWRTVFRTIWPGLIKRKIKSYLFIWSINKLKDRPWLLIPPPTFAKQPNSTERGVSCCDPRHSRVRSPSRGGSLLLATSGGGRFYGTSLLFSMHAHCPIRIPCQGSVLLQNVLRRFPTSFLYLFIFVSSCPAPLSGVSISKSL